MDHADVLKPDEVEIASSKSLWDRLDEQDWEGIIPRLLLVIARHFELRDRGFRLQAEGMRSLWRRTATELMV